MSEMQDTGAPAPETTTPETEAADTSAQDSLEQELSQLESEGLESEESSEEPKAEAKSESKADSAKQAKADKAAKSEGAKKVGEDKFQLKVDGEVVELTRDEMIKYAQLGKAGQQRMAEAAQIRKEAAQLIADLRNNPEDILSDPAILGSKEKVIEFAKKLLSKELEEEAKSPEMKEREALQKEIEELRKKEKEREETAKRAEFERLVEAEHQKLESEITEAIESSGLPKSPFVLKRMTDVMISAEEFRQKAAAEGREVKPLSPKQAMAIVRKEMEKDLKEYFELTPEELLENLIGGERIKSIRKKQLAKIREQAAKTNVPSPSQVKPTPSNEVKEEKPKKVNMKDFLRR